MEFCWANHSLYSKTAVAKFEEFRQNDKFCDVSLCSQNIVVKAHRVVLAAVSPYFEAMFTSGLRESNEKFVHLPGIHPDVLPLLVDFIYRGRVTIQQSTAQQLLMAAHMLCINDLVNDCIRVLKCHLNSSNVLSTFRFAESLNCSDLSERALIYAGEHWATIAQREELLDLPFIVFSKMLSSNEFAVQNEMDVVLAVVRWLQHEPTSRAKCCPDLVRHLRLNSLPTHVLDEIWNKLLDAQLLELFRLSSEQMTAITHARPRGCVFSLYLVGGSVENMDSEATVLKYDVHKRTWEIMAPMATPRYNVGVAALGGRLYAVGGYMYNLNYEETLSTGEVYDPTTNKWSPMAAMDEAREGMGVVVFNEKLYVFGGDGAYGELSSIEAYDPEADKWTPAGDMPHALYNMSIVTHRGAIYIAGGKMPSCTSKSLLRYEPTAGLRGEWRYCAEMSRRRHGHAAAVLDDWLYVIGGYDDANGIMDSVTRYDFGTDRWEDVAPLQQGRAACAAGAAGGALLVAGGHDGSHLSSLETYAAADDCWRRGPDMPWPCSDVGYAVLRY